MTNDKEKGGRTQVTGITDGDLIALPTEKPLKDGMQVKKNRMTNDKEKGGLATLSQPQATAPMSSVAVDRVACPPFSFSVFHAHVMNAALAIFG
jgi:hypothetical protein